MVDYVVKWNSSSLTLSPRPQSLTAIQPLHPTKLRFESPIQDLWFHFPQPFLQTPVHHSSHRQQRSGRISLRMRIPLKQVLEFRVLPRGRGASAHSTWWWSVVWRESLGDWTCIPGAGVHVALGHLPEGKESGRLQMPGGRPALRRQGLRGVCCLKSGTGEGGGWD